MCVLFLLSNTTEVDVAIYFLHVSLSLAYKGTNTEIHCIAKKSCILVSKRVMSLTFAISDLSDNENCFLVQDRRVILELVEVNYAANQREEGKDYF